MNDGIFGGIYNHSWSRPAHYLTNGLSFFGSIAVSRAVFASGFLFAISAMVEAATSIFRQMLIFLRCGILMKMMLTVKINHLPNDLFFLLYSSHIFFLIFLLNNRKVRQLFSCPSITSNKV